jgi:hypothetical protein
MTMIEQWQQPHDIEIPISYPGNLDFGSKVTCIALVWRSNSKETRARIVSGGIGNRHIELVLEAKRATYMQYVLVFYGKK